MKIEHRPARAPQKLKIELWPATAAARATTTVLTTQTTDIYIYINLAPTSRSFKIELFAGYQLKSSSYPSRKPAACRDPPLHRQTMTRSGRLFSFCNFSCKFQCFDPTCFLQHDILPVFGFIQNHELKHFEDLSACER